MRILLLAACTLLLVACGGEHDREFGLLDRGRCCNCPWGRRHRHRRCRGHAPFFLEQLGEFRRFQDRELRELVDQMLEICHFSVSYIGFDVEYFQCL